MTYVAPTNSNPLRQNNETMRYRKFGSTGYSVSALSMGCMRLSPDMGLNRELISTAIDQGVNYFETTRGYLDGHCQHRTAPGLKGKSDNVIVSGKGAIGPDCSEFMFRKEIETQLEILGLTHFKFYQVGWLTWENFKHLIKPGGPLDALRQAQKEGLVHHIGFTGHETPENIIKLLETGLFDSFTTVYNMVTRVNEPAIKRAGELGIGVVAMCPVGGGMLSAQSDKLQEAIGVELPTPEMSLRFVLSNPNISTACSGMSTMEMLEQNVRTVKEFEPADGDYEVMCESLDRLREEWKDGFCTSCGYCMPCPHGVEIPWLMRTAQQAKAWGLKEWGQETLDSVPEDKSAVNCTECGECEDKCPNNLPIIKTIKAGL